MVFRHMTANDTAPDLLPPVEYADACLQRLLAGVKGYNVVRRATAAGPARLRRSLVRS